MLTIALDPWGRHAANIAMSVYALLLVSSALWLWRNRDTRSFATISQRIPTRSLRFNLTMLLLDLAFVGVLCGFLLTQLRELFGQAGWWLDSSLYDSLPAWLVAFLVLFVGDFVGYWRHRLEHSRWLWPAHVMYHSDEQMT